MKEGWITMKVWELEVNKVYVYDNKKFHVNHDGYLHIARVLKRNGGESWFGCDLPYNEVKDMHFVETDWGLYD